MSFVPFPPDIMRSPIAPALAAAIAVGIFIVDTITDLEIAVAVLYVAVVLMAVSFCRRRQVMFVAAGCMALTVISYGLTRTGSPHSGLTNLALSLGAIAATTYLALKISAAERAMHEARAQLIHIARVTTLGELATSIAHEVNQPLGAIALNGSAATRWLGATPPNIAEAMSSIEEIVKDANRAGSIVARIRSLARAAPIEQERFDVNEAIEEITSLMRREIEKNGIALEMRLAADLPPARGDRVQIQQIVLNLILNAIEALTSPAVSRRDLTIATRRENEQRIVVSTRDSGPGVSADKLERIFEAFYTTKANGLGIGLAIARSIVESHSGRLWAAPTSDGFEICFTLPVDGSRAAA